MNARCELGVNTQDVSACEVIVAERASASEKYREGKELNGYFVALIYLYLLCV